MKKFLISIAIVLLLVSCDQMITNGKVEAVKTVYTISHGEYEGGLVKRSPIKTEYRRKEKVTISAECNEGWKFVGWSGDVISSDTSITITINKNMVIIPVFKEIVKRQWTFLIYMAADNDLEAEAIKDLNELEGVNYEDEPLSIIVLLDRSPRYDNTNGNWSGTRLYEIQTDTAGVDGIIRSKELFCPELAIGSDNLANLNTADPDTLSKCIEYVKKYYDADNYGFIMWGHGTGWRGGGGEAGNTKAFAIDETSSSYMTNAEFGQAIDGKGLSVAGFDTCYGGLLETAYEIKESAQYMIASEGSVPASGWDYRSLFSSFLENDLSASSFGDAAVTQFKNQYAGVQKSVISVIDLSQIQAVKNKFDDFSSQAAAQVISSSIRSNMLSIILDQTLNYSQSSYPCELYVDIYSLSKKLSEAYSNLNTSAIQLQTALETAIVNSWSSSLPDGNNIGVYFCDLRSQGVPSSVHNESYVKGSGALLQSKFVKENTGWVPTKNTEGSLLDKIFYSNF